MQRTHQWLSETGAWQMDDMGEESQKIQTYS